MTVLIDGNNIGFIATATTRGADPRAIVTNFIARLRPYVFERRSTFVLWDGRSWRFDVLPSYKGNRDLNPDLVELKRRWVEARHILIDVLRPLGVIQLTASNMEADDLAARIIRSIPNDRRVLLVTGDKDWMQLVTRDYIAWGDPVRGRSVQFRTFLEDTGCVSPRTFIETKALTGDQGDNIPGVGGIGPVAAQWIMNNFDGVDDLLSTHATNGLVIPVPTRVEKFITDKDKIAAYHRNLLLVDLNHKDAPATQGLSVLRESYNKARFLDACEAQGIACLMLAKESFFQAFASAEIKESV